jgi:3-oxoacyl-[acyl-carrier-protein] synthase III
MNADAALGIPPDRLHIVGDRTGDIGAASAPFALADAAARGTLRERSRVLVCVFGAGLTWGSTLLVWTSASSMAAPVRTNPVPVLAIGAHA